MAVDADVRFQVFLSSTYEDLREERQQATQAILEMSHMPSGMELFPASDLSQWELIKAVINESDYYVVIVAGRYGSIHQTTGFSFTEMEYDYAVANSIPVLGFVRADIAGIPSGKVESDFDSRAKLNTFRQKVMSRTCRLFDNPVELGMLVMKSLMNETRVNPRIGWVRADRARGTEDVEREQALIKEIETKNKTVKKLERQLRDHMVPLSGVDKNDLSQGQDDFLLIVSFQKPIKGASSIEIEVTWDELFSVVAPTMYGYIIRRSTPSYNELIGRYPFEGSLAAYIRSRFFDRIGGRQITFLPHQIDTMLIQFKQLGLLVITEKTKDEDGQDFRGYSLTAAGEEHLTRLKLQTLDQC